MKKTMWFGIMVVIIAFAGVSLAADGAKLYTNKCFACHGQKGAGTPMAPALKGNEFITKGDVNQVKKIILEGRTGRDKKYPKFPADMPKIPMPEDAVTTLINFLQGDMQK